MGEQQSVRRGLRVRLSLKDYDYEALKNDFRNGVGFNDLFEAFRKAIESRVDNVELYRELLWNKSLSVEELLFFAKKIGEVFPRIGYDTYMWLSNIFGSRVGEVDGLEMAFLCLKKASDFRPSSDEPYMNACDLYNPDLKVPTLQSIMAFLRVGEGKVDSPKNIFERLSTYYGMMGNDEMSKYYERKSRRSS